MSSVNEMHTEIKNLIRRKHGISTRHLQGYLDWLLLIKRLRYTLDMRKLKPQTYLMKMQELMPFKWNDIGKQSMPLNLYSAYGEYHYDIFQRIIIVIITAGKLMCCLLSKYKIRKRHEKEERLYIS